MSGGRGFYAIKMWRTVAWLCFLWTVIGRCVGSELIPPNTAVATRNFPSDVLAIGWSTTLLSSRVVLGVGNTANADHGHRSAGFLYHLDTNEWTATGDLPDGVVGLGQSVTALANGKALALGRNAKHEPVAFLFDPGSGLWTPTGAVRGDSGIGYGLQSVLLPTGAVLVLREAQPRAGWLYDPRENRWSMTGAFPVETRGFPYVVPLANGLVFVIAQGADLSKSWVAMLYDPVENTWEETGALPGKFQGALAWRAVLGDGSVLVMGYQYEPRIEICALIYHPRSNEWVKVGRPPSDVFGIRAMWRMPGGRIFISVMTLRRGEVSMLFDPVKDEWTPIAAPAGLAFGIGMLGSLADGSTWGIGYRSHVLADALHYSAAKNTWEAIGPLPAGLEHVSPALENGAVLIFTGPNTGGVSRIEKSFLYLP